MRVTIALLLSLALAAPALAARGPSTPAERTKTIELARQLESDPLGKNANAARQWLTIFLVEVPDLTVSICSNFLGSYMEQEHARAAEIVTQMAFSAAAFAYEHPDQANDEAAKYLAGIEGALRAYEAIVTAEPKERHAALDALIARRDKGELVAYVRETTPKCKD